MSVYKLEKPDISEHGLTIEDYANHEYYLTLSELAIKANQPKYLYWDKIKFFNYPEGIEPLKFWGFLKGFRNLPFTTKRSLLRNEDGEFFHWNMLEHYHYKCDEFERALAGGMSPASQFDEYKSRIIKTKWLMEESITSAQLEGAHTTLDAAKKILRENRKPKNNSERMIVNNYKTMLALEQDFKDVNLDRTALFQLHEMLVRDTDIKKDAIGRFRNDSENIMIFDDNDGTIYHIPPKEAFMLEEVDRLLAYANDEITDDGYIRPVIKAIILHFWMGYLHPFVDGNGRLARALFHWYLLKHGYWAITVLPISVMIRKSSKQYGMAYVYSEQDDNDLTYFIDYNIRKMYEAKKSLDEYIEKQKIMEDRISTTVGSQSEFNERQTQLVIHLFKNPGSFTTIKTHSTIYKVSRVTARKDLELLSAAGYLHSKKVGREVRYFPTDKLKQLRVPQ
ncbi:MAG: Fic family protein [Candidatus Zixiibacteriota bacterium]